MRARVLKKLWQSHQHVPIYNFNSLLSFTPYLCSLSNISQCTHGIGGVTWTKTSEVTGARLSYRLDALPDAQPTMSKHLRQLYHRNVHIISDSPFLQWSDAVSWASSPWTTNNPHSSYIQQGQLLQTNHASAFMVDCVRIFLTSSLITVPHLVSVSHTVCTHVTGPLGDARALTPFTGG